MPQGVFHLHELPTGSAFTFRTLPRVCVLREMTPSSCIISDIKSERSRRSFVANGEEVSFLEAAAATKICSPGCEVFPLAFDVEP